MTSMSQFLVMFSYNTMDLYARLKQVELGDFTGEVIS